MKNTCAVTIPGHRDEQSSYRGELGGILTGISIANSLLTKEGITSGECTFCCDNKGALDASFGWKNPNPTWTCYDLVSAIRHQLHTSPIAWSHQHIHGHQDKDQHFDELSAVAQANVLVDKLAKEELRALRTPDEDNTSITDMWKLTCEGQHITGDIEQRLRYFMQETVSKQWWTQTLRIPSGSENQISWEVYYAYRKTTPLWLNTWSVKFGADILPTRKTCCEEVTATHINVPAVEQTMKTRNTSINAPTAKWTKLLKKAWTIYQTICKSPLAETSNVL